MKLDDVKKLHQKKYRQSLGSYLIEGEHLLLELERSQIQPSSAVEIYVTESFESWQTRFKKTLVSEKRMAQLSDTPSPQGIVARVPMPANIDLPNPSSKLKTVYLYEPQDPGNLGTILRTLAWFGGFHLALSPNSVDPFNMKVVRASMGALFHVPLSINVPLSALSQFDSLAYLDINGTSITQPQFKDHRCYVFGNEARGIPNELKASTQAHAYTIEGCGAIESLNLASALNISIFQLAS